MTYGAVEVSDEAVPHTEEIPGSEKGVEERREEERKNRRGMGSGVRVRGYGHRA